MGIECTFVNPDATDEEIEKAFRPNTKCVFGETISNPMGDIFDIERFANLAHKHGVPLIVDNTFATPINCRPFEWGADIVTHSTTKYMDGHATAVGGCIVDSGRFNWMEHADKFPLSFVYTRRELPRTDLCRELRQHGLHHEGYGTADA